MSSLGIPGVIWTDENGTDRYVDLATRLLRDRIILIEGEINSRMSAAIVAQLRYLESESADKPITLLIQSPGGEINAGYAIIDTMNDIKCPVHTIAMGMTASMAVTIFLNGKKGERSVYKHTELLIHQPLSGVQGQVSDIERSAKHSVKLKDQLAKEYSKLTGIELKKMVEMMDRDTILDAQECVKLGLADKIK